MISRQLGQFGAGANTVTAGCASSPPYLAREPLKDHLMNSNHMVHAVDHIGFAVSSLEEAIRFWTIGLGFTLERQSEMGGSFILQVKIGRASCRERV